MIIDILITIAAAMASIFWFESEALPQAATVEFSSVTAQVSPSPSPTRTPSPTSSPVIPGMQAAVSLAASPTPTPTATPAATTIIEKDENCDGKEIHVERRNGEDVSVEVECDKQVEGGGSVSNSVSIDAKTGGKENSGNVNVDLNISNRVGQ